MGDQTTDDNRNSAAIPLPPTAAAMGVLLTISGLMAFLLISIFGHPQASLGYSALSGVILLFMCVTGLVIICRALGIASPAEALGLPPGSVRALLALGLVVVFAAAASWIVQDHTSQLFQEDVASPEAGSRADALKAQGYSVVISGASGPVSTIHVLSSNQVSGAALDISKQLLTTIATVLVTVVGFYFGSNTVADVIPTSGAGTPSPPAAATHDLDKLSGVRTRAANIKKDVEGLGPNPLAIFGEKMDELTGEDRARVANLMREAATLISDAKVACDAATGMLLKFDATGDMTNIAEVDQTIEKSRAALEQLAKLKAQLGEGG